MCRDNRQTSSTYSSGRKKVEENGTSLKLRENAGEGLKKSCEKDEAGRNS